jgi:hypothetical protein
MESAAADGMLGMHPSQEMRPVGPLRIHAGKPHRGQPRLGPINDFPQESLRASRKSHENSVHYFRVKNITLSADEDLIEQARSIARKQRRTLNDAFREWLAQFAQSAGDAQGFDTLMTRMNHINAGRRFSRDELNER